jgi:hypothetical protein
MSATAQIVFTADGKAMGLYTEIIDLTRIGRLKVTRKLRVEYDNERQVWRVKDGRRFPLFTAAKRQECIDWEEKYLNSVMERELEETTNQQEEV